MPSSHDKSPDAYEKLVDRLLARQDVRRALGADVARPGPICRFGRLRVRRAADDLGLSRLRDPLVQREQAVRPVHDRADRRRPAAQSDRGAAHRHGLPPQHANEQRRRLRPRGVPQRGHRRSRQHDDVGLDGHDDGLLPVPRPQVRSDHAEGVFSASSRSSTTPKTPTAKTNTRCSPSTPSGKSGSARSCKRRSPRLEPQVPAKNERTASPPKPPPAKKAKKPRSREPASKRRRIARLTRVPAPSRLSARKASGSRRSRPSLPRSPRPPCRSSGSCRRASAARRLSSIAATSSTAGRK